jgi:hypothetical protein
MPRVTTQEDYCPDCIKNQAREAMTWAVQDTDSIPMPTSPTPTLAGTTFILVGADSETDAINGDTPVNESAPILCRKALSAPIILEGTLEALYELNATAPIRGDTLGSRVDADNLCAASFGHGWHMLEVSPNPREHRVVGVGTLPTHTRFWVAHPAAPVNPWID